MNVNVGILTPFQKYYQASGIYMNLFVARDFLATPTTRAWGSVSSESRERLGRRLLGTTHLREYPRDFFFCFVFCGFFCLFVAKIKHTGAEARVQILALIT